MIINKISPVLFNRLFDVRPGEWSRILPLLLVTIFCNMGFVWGITITTAAFLQDVGIDSLPRVMVAVSTCSILVITVYTIFVDRITKDAMMAIILMVELIGLATGAALLYIGADAIAYSLLYCLLYVASGVVGTHLTTYLSNYFDTRASKRVIPIILAGNRMGAIIGGLLLPFMNHIFPPLGIIVLWMGVHLLSILIIRRLGRTLQPAPHPLTGRSGKNNDVPPTLLTETSEGFRYTLNSSFLRWLAVGTLSVMMIMALLEYQSSKLLLDAFDSVDEMANFLGLLLVVANLITLPILFFGLNRIIARIGVANTSLIFPFANILVCFGMVTIPGLFIASTAYLHRLTLRGTLYLPVEGLLYNAVPLRIKGRVRAFGNGLLTPLGKMVGSLLLFLPWIAGVWYVSGLIILLTVIYTTCALYIRYRYSQALLAMLEEEDYSFLLDPDASALNQVDPATMRLLGKRLNEDRGYKHTVFMAQLLSRIGGNESIPLIINQARQSDNPRVRAAMITVLMAADFREDQVRNFYVALLTDDDAKVRHEAIRGIRALYAPEDKKFQNLLLSMVEDKDIEVGIEALDGLAQCSDFHEMEQAAAFLEKLLRHRDKQHRIRAIRILGASCAMLGTNSAQRLSTFLADPLAAARLEAVLAFEKMAGMEKRVEVIDSEQTRSLSRLLTPLLDDNIDRIRQATHTILGRLGGKTALTSLMCGLADQNEAIRKQCVDLLVDQGETAEPLLLSSLQSENPQVYRGVIVALARLQPGKFSDKARQLIDDTLKNIYYDLGCVAALQGCKGYLAPTALKAALNEYIILCRDEIFYLLSSSQDSSNLTVVQEALTQDDPLVRANGIETLESLTSPQIAKLMQPLFEDRIDFSRVGELARRTWGMDMDVELITPAILYLAKQHTDPWVNHLARFLLGEMLALVNPAREKSLTERLALPVQRKCSLAELISHQPRHPSPVIHSREDINNTGIIEDIQREVDNALRLMIIIDPDTTIQENIVLSAIEKIIFLKDVPFFRGMTIEQLGILANACEEVFCPGGERIFRQGDPGGTLYVVVNGHLGIDKEIPGKNPLRLNTIGPFSFLGEATLFDASPRTASCVAIQDSMVLRLSREPLMALAAHHPELSIELINVLGEQLRTVYERIDKMKPELGD